MQILSTLSLELSALCSQIQNGTPCLPGKKKNLAMTAVPDCRFAITLTDYYPVFAAEDVIKFLFLVVSRHGDHESTVTDNGTQFIYAAFRSFLQTHASI